VLALAAVALGAAHATGIDDDPDAVQSALDNLTLNPALREVAFEVADLFSSPLPEADVITANLTGAFLARAARLLVGRLRPGGTLVVSGLLEDERGAVLQAFADGPPVVWEGGEAGWVALAMRQPS
jgi:ribosomal protein L11 methyltransferase